jgi:hypothetical protein
MLVSLTTLVQFTQYMIAVIDMKSVRLPHGRQNFVRPFGVALVPMQLSDQSGKMPLAFFSMAFRLREMLQQGGTFDLTPYHAANSPYCQCAALIFSLEIYHAVGVRESRRICLP